jgi:hypothetical protein
MADSLILYGNNRSLTSLKPAGPYTLSSRLKEEGFSCECLDISSFLLNIHDINLLFKILANLITKETIWLGFSTVFCDKIFDLKITRLNDSVEKISHLPPIFNSLLEYCKSLNPNIKFITGGSLHIDLSKFGIIQFIGFADEEIVKFTKNHNSINYKLNTKIIGNEYKDFNTKSYIDWTCTRGLIEKEALPIEIARGCIFKCKFCAYPLNGKTKGNWVKEINLLKNEMEKAYSINKSVHFTFCDDTYNDDVNKVELLYNQVFSKLSFKPKITCYTRLDLMERFPHTAEILVESGLVSTVIGIETNNKKSAVTIGKGKDFHKQIDYVRYLKETHFKNTMITSGFILGFPYDTIESWENLREFLLSNNNPLDSWNVAYLRLNPNTSSMHRNYFSEFDKNWSTYGYVIVNENKNDAYGVQWDLPGSGFDSKLANKFATEITNESLNSDNYKYGSWTLAGLTTIGIPEEKVKQLSYKKLNTEYDIQKLKINHITKHLNNFL